MELIQLLNYIFAVLKRYKRLSYINNRKKIV